MVRIPILKERVDSELFDSAVSSYSGFTIENELVSPPFRWMNGWWVCMHMELSHSYSWANCYELEPLGDWVGPVHVFGNWNPEWEDERNNTGRYWYSVRCSVLGDDSGQEYVLTRNKILIRER